MTAGDRAVLITIAGIMLALFSIYSAGHALLNQRDPRAALGWVAVCLFFPPGTGALLYWLFGVNRIHTTALRWQRRGHWQSTTRNGRLSDFPKTELPSPLKDDAAALLAVSDRIAGRPVLGGNRVVMLQNGEEAYPAMLAAIASARRSVYLCTYIFDTDVTGRRFIEALGEASARGVDVRVLVDGLGALYSRPPAPRHLRRAGVRTARFLPMSRGIHVNLRNHRKLLVVDGGTGFTGGMNIGDRHLATNEANPRRVADLHFQIDGPVVMQMEEVFMEDWHFSTGDALPTSPPIRPADAGDAYCKGISDGPNHDFEKLHWIIIGAVSTARARVRIMTPYFIPNRALLSVLTAAAFRGVDVEIILPLRNNLPYMAWAAQAFLWELLEHGIRVYYQPPPFVHSKYLLIDRAYVLVGSSNLDSRSLRLNFEFNLEIYDLDAAEALHRHFEAVRGRSRQTTFAEVDGRPFPVKLRDAATKLFAPYL
jgi:cardiolipin synthase